MLVFVLFKCDDHICASMWLLSNGTIKMLLGNIKAANIYFQRDVLCVVFISIFVFTSHCGAFVDHSVPWGVM